MVNVNVSLNTTASGSSLIINASATASVWDDVITGSGSSETSVTVYPAPAQPEATLVYSGGTTAQVYCQTTVLGANATVGGSTFIYSVDVSDVYNAGVSDAADSIGSSYTYTGGAGFISVDSVSASNGSLDVSASYHSITASISATASTATANALVDGSAVDTATTSLTAAYNDGYSDGYYAGQNAGSGSGSGGSDSGDSGGTGGGCFLGGSMVRLADGSERPIEQLTPGLILACYDPDEEQYGETEVMSLKQFKNRSDVFEIQLDSGRTLILTDSHPLLTRHGWKAINPDKAREEHHHNIPMTELTEADEILSFNDCYVGINSIRYREDLIGCTVYNIDVEEVDTYFVEGIVAHNVDTTK